MRVDHHNGAISLEATIPIREGYDLHEVHGQGRVVGFLTRKPHWSLWAVVIYVIHLDYPGVSMEFEIPPAYAAGAGSNVNDLLPSRALVSLNVTLFPSGTSASQPKV